MNDVNNTKTKILIVDDCPVDIDVLTMVLEKNKYLVKALTTTDSFIETIECEKPDLILLDIVMPQISGNELLKIVRKKWSQIELPVIMVTSKSSATDVIESLEIGANDYITKPVEFSIALRRIETQLTIVSMTKKMNQLKEIETIHAMITTYNHEINNPLSIAIGIAEDLSKKYLEEENLKQIQETLWRIANIVKKINHVMEHESVEYEQYTKSTKMLKLNRGE